MIFKQFQEPKSCTYTYLLGCTQSKQAVLIDPAIEDADLYIAELEKLGLTLAFTIETHVHADHLTAARKLAALTGSKIAGPALSCVECYDLCIKEGVALDVGTISILPIPTPGHTDGCTSYLVDSGTHKMVFTGDALLIDGCGRTDFQAGNAQLLYHSITQKLFTLPDETLVYPAHDYHGRRVSSIGQEKARNPRLGQRKSEVEFVEIMNNLNLPKPRLIDYAVPGNLRCGQCPPDVPAELKAPCEIDKLKQG